MCKFKNSNKVLLILEFATCREKLHIIQVSIREDALSIMSSGGDTIETMLNKVLEGKIKLNESELDAFGFDEEEFSFTFNNNEEGNVDITKLLLEKLQLQLLRKKLKNLLNLLQMRISERALRKRKLLQLRDS